jgi:hypothetical protein
LHITSAGSNPPDSSNTDKPWLALDAAGLYFRLDQNSKKPHQGAAFYGWPFD